MLLMLTCTCSMCLSRCLVHMLKVKVNVTVCWLLEGRTISQWMQDCHSTLTLQHMLQYQLSMLQHLQSVQVASPFDLVSEVESESLWLNAQSHQCCCMTVSLLQDSFNCLATNIYLQTSLSVYTQTTNLLCGTLSAASAVQLCSRSDASISCILYGMDRRQGALR